MIPQANTITPPTMPKEDGGPVTYLKNDVKEEAIPPYDNKLPKTFSVRDIMRTWDPIQTCSPYFTLVMALQSLSFSFRNLHNHLLRRASLKLIKSLMPKPPLGKGCLTIFHSTK